MKHPCLPLLTGLEVCSVLLLFFDRNQLTSSGFTCERLKSGSTLNMNSESPKAPNYPKICRIVQKYFMHQSNNVKIIKTPNYLVYLAFFGDFCGGHFSPHYFASRLKSSNKSLVPDLKRPAKARSRMYTIFGLKYTKAFISTIC